MAEDSTNNESVAFLLIKTANFAAIKHKNQKRKDPERTPYINHPIGVAEILTEEAKITDCEVLQTALLHDTVEDTNTSYDELVSVFGKAVADLVMELSDDKTLPSPIRKQQQIEHAPHASHKAKLVKLADKLYNLRDLVRSTPEGWTEQRVNEYFAWAARVVDGLRGTNQLMEDKLDELFVENLKRKSSPW